MKFWIWLAALAGSIYMGYTTAALIIWSIGILLFFFYLLVSSPDQYKIADGVVVKSVTQENGNTIIKLSNGEIQMFPSTKVQIAGNIITVG
jgi:hypothetical protein